MDCVFAAMTRKIVAVQPSASSSAAMYEMTGPAADFRKATVRESRTCCNHAGSKHTDAR
jgi:hypothetical protein